MLQANTSVRLGDMQNMVYNFTADVASDLCSTSTRPAHRTAAHRRVRSGWTGCRTCQEAGHYTPEMRQGDFFDFNLKVKPYSMARPDPNMAVRRKLEFATNVIPAAAQAAMMLGPGFKVGPFLRRMAIEVGIEDADEFLNDPAFQAWIMQRIQMDTVGEVLHLRGGELAVDGGIVGLLHRDVIASMRVHADMGYQQPILSEALAIHPSQIPEARQRFPHHEYTPDGRMVLRSHTQRNQVLRELGFHDRGK
jgi:hypothetical protein